MWDAVVGCSPEVEGGRGFEGSRVGVEFKQTDRKKVGVRRRNLKEGRSRVGSSDGAAERAVPRQEGKESCTGGGFGGLSGVRALGRLWDAEVCHGW